MGKLTAQIKTLRHSLQLFDEQFTSTVKSVEKLEHCLSLYQRRTMDPAALPQLMAELGLISREAESVLADVNRLFILKSPKSGGTDDRSESEQVDAQLVDQ